MCGCCTWTLSCIDFVLPLVRHLDNVVLLLCCLEDRFDHVLQHCKVNVIVLPWLISQEMKLFTKMHIVLVSGSVERESVEKKKREKKRNPTPIAPSGLRRIEQKKAQTDSKKKRDTIELFL